MLYFSEIQLKFIVTHSNDFDMKDGVLVCCQQMIELLIKHLLQKKTGSYEQIHSLIRLISDLDRTLVKTHRELLTTLTDCYFDCRYASDTYYDFNKEEFEEIVNKSLKLREILLDMDKVKPSKSFT